MPIIMRESRAVVLLCALLLRKDWGNSSEEKHCARLYFRKLLHALSLSRERSSLRRGGDDGEKRRRRRRRAAAEKAVVGVQRAHLLLTLGVFFPSRRRFGIRQLLDGIMRLARTTTTEEEEDKREMNTTTTTLLTMMLLSSKLARWWSQKRFV